MARGKTVVTVISKISERPATHLAALVVIYGIDLGRKFDLSKAVVNIGRSSKCDIQIDQESVSRTHVKLTNDGTREFLTKFAKAFTAWVDRNGKHAKH